VPLVGVVTTSYPRGEADFAGGFVRTRVRALVGAGAAVEVLAAGGPTDAPERPEPGVEVVRIPFSLPAAAPLFYGAGGPEALEGGGLAWLQAALFSARLAEAVRARARRWARIETHWLVPCGLLGLVVAGDLPHRAHAHSGDVALIERLPLGDALVRALARGGAELVFASDDLRARFVRRGGLADREVQRLRVEAAPIEPAFLAGRPPIPSRGPREGAPRDGAGQGIAGPLVLGVGRLVPVKGFDLLVRAVGRLPPGERPTVVLLGEGPERPRLLALAAARGVDLRLPGAVPPAEVVRWLAGADLFVLPSRRLPGGRTEGMPLAAREALAAGLPVVAAAVGGLAELAGHPRVTLVAPEDPGALARVLTVTFST
jgi:glycosyltransferase involved in cell wall biosynthesis